jgi:hypothetical protein
LLRPSYVADIRPKLSLVSIVVITPLMVILVLLMTRLIWAFAPILILMVLYYYLAYARFEFFDDCLKVILLFRKTRIIPYSRLGIDVTESKNGSPNYWIFDKDDPDRSRWKIIDLLNADRDFKNSLYEFIQQKIV